jgi:hypothetical protein
MNKTDFMARWRENKILVEKRNVWMLRETDSVKEVVGGSWRRTRYYRTDAGGRDRDGGTWANDFFVDLCGVWD